MGKTKRKDNRGMDAQVLLLRDPGAELGWAELSDTLPSAGGREGTHGHPNKTRLTTRRNQNQEEFGDIHVKAQTAAPTGQTCIKATY